MNLGDMKDMFGQMKAAQQQMKEFQKKLSAMRIQVETGGGMVKATVDGEATLVDLDIDTSLLEPNEIKILPKLILKAVNEAQKKAKNQVAQEVQSMAGGLNIPGMQGMPGMPEN